MVTHNEKMEIILGLTIMKGALSDGALKGEYDEATLVKLSKTASALISETASMYVQEYFPEKMEELGDSTTVLATFAEKSLRMVEAIVEAGGDLDKVSESTGK